MLSPTTRQICLGVSSIQPELRERLPKTCNIEARILELHQVDCSTGEQAGTRTAAQASAAVGELLARRAEELQIPAVHWERKQGHQKYHGKVKALLEAMQKAGLPLC